MNPTILYHGSPNRDITVLEPREESPGHKLPGQYVFATQYKELAAMFLAPKVAPMQMSKFNETYALIVRCSKETYEIADTGGAMYELPSSSFQKGPTDMPDVEWFSSEPVRPSRKHVYDSSLDAMNECGVTVYFVNNATYAAIQNAEDHGWEILREILHSEFQTTTYKLAAS